MTTEDAISAYRSHDWLKVTELLADAESLTSDQLLLRADALYWTGRFDDSIDTFEKAFTKLVAEHQRAEAGRIAALLAYFALRRGAISVAYGWLTQAQEMLEGQPQNMGHAWLKLLMIGKALFVDGDMKTAVSLGDEALQVAEEVGSRSAQSLAVSFKALAMIHDGDWKQALGLLDRSVAMAMGGDDLRMSSDVYCNTISSCRNLGDYKRAGEWTEEADRWMRSNSVTGYTGACQVHRAELKRLNGSWLEAEDEARKACVELDRFHLDDYLGAAHYEIGEIRRRMGDLEAATDAFDRAYEKGHDAQPGMSLLMLDKGDPVGALASIRGAYRWREADDERSIARGPSRARLLPSMIDIALSADQVDMAEEWVEALAAIADAYESEVWHSATDYGRGGVELHRGNAADAVEHLDRAWRSFRHLDLPYEMALARARLGEAKRALGDGAGADMESKAALATLRQLGATGDAAQVSNDLGETVDSRATPKRVTRTFMFTDIVTSTDLIGLIGDDAWQDLLEWHDRTLRSSIESVGGEVVRHTGDGYFASFSSTRPAVDCAVDINRKLNRHRRDAGFAPQVRIGIHRTEANRTGNDYSGGGIHLAARIAAHGRADQIAISSETLADAGNIPYGVSEPEDVQLKGISEPVKVQNIDWRK